MSQAQVPSAILQTLSEILVAQSPQYAARLKQRLTAALELKGEQPFDEKKHGFKGFRDFLLNGTQGLFSVSKNEEEDDLIVSLLSTGTHKFTVVRGDVWQAFTNPDLSRVRYLNIHTYAIRHFLRGETSVHSTAVADAPDDYVEIQPINSQIQVEWMRDFVEKSKIEPSQKIMLNGLIAKPYTSGVNAVFTGALGSLSESWAQVRFKRVVDFIQDWAKRNNLIIEKLSPRQGGDSVAVSVRTQHKPQSALNNSNAMTHENVMAPRDQAVKLLEMISNDDISRVVIPILLSTLLVRGKD